VNMSYFASNNELFARQRAGNPGFDVIVPSNATVTRMAQAGMLMQIDHAKIPNMANLAPDFLDAAFDPGWAHSVPYTWGLIGVGYRRSAVSEIPNSWQALFDSDEYAGRISLLGESADLCRIGAKYLGHSVIGVTPEILAEVEAMFIRQKPHVRVFHEDNGQDLLLAGDVDLVMEYNGDIAQIMEEDDDIDFVVIIDAEDLVLRSVEADAALQDHVDQVHVRVIVEVVVPAVPEDLDRRPAAVRAGQLDVDLLAV